MSQPYVIARFRFKPDRVAEGRKLLQGFVGPSLKQEGCLSYELFQSREDVTEFYIVDGWATDANLKAHAESEVVVRIVEQLQPLLAETVELKTFNRAT